MCELQFRLCAYQILGTLFSAGDGRNDLNITGMREVRTVKQS